MLLWLSSASSLAVIGAMQFTPALTAKAQTDPGQNPEPTPRVEATATPTPCPTKSVEIVWTTNAQLKGFKCTGGAWDADSTQGAYQVLTKGNCKPDSSTSCTSEWKKIAQRPITTIENEGTPDEIVITEYEYQFQEVGSCGENFGITEWKKPSGCCG